MAFSKIKTFSSWLKTAAQINRPSDRLKKMRTQKTFLMERNTLTKETVLINPLIKKHSSCPKSLTQTQLT